MTLKAWAAYETIVVGIPNPRAVVWMLIPPGSSPAELARIEAEIDRINEKLVAVEPEQGSQP
jgi:hypothetical protein